MNLEDNLYNLLKLYDKSPKLFRLFIGKLYLLVPEFFRIGKKYKEFKLFIHNSEFWDKQKLYEYQNSEFLKVIEYAKRTAFYPQYYKEYGIDINRIKSIDDIVLLPFITKDTLKNNLNNIIVNENKKHGLYITTGGSTGIPVGFYLEKGVSRPKELAFMEDQWSRVGYNHNDKCAVIRGGVVSSISQDIISKIDYLRNWLILSSYHLKDNNLTQYIDKLNNFKPKFIQGYPSALYIISKFINNNNIKLLFQPTAILAGSENIYIYQKAAIEKAFNCKLYSWYGHAERIILGGYCEYNDRYHLFPQYGYPEVINNKGEVIRSGEGELIGTTFHNKIMPLIRYKTSDIVILSKDQECECRRHYLLLDKIEGREQELIVSATGRKISMTAINMHSDIFDNIKQFQFVQNKMGEVTFNYIEFCPIDNKEKKRIIKELMFKLGDDFKLKLNKVENIKLTKSGKHRFLIQNLEKV